MAFLTRAAPTVTQAMEQLLLLFNQRLRCVLTRGGGGVEPVRPTLYLMCDRESIIDVLHITKCLARLEMKKITNRIRVS